MPASRVVLREPRTAVTALRTAASRPGGWGVPEQLITQQMAVEWVDLRTQETARSPELSLFRTPTRAEPSVPLRLPGRSRHLPCGSVYLKKKRGGGGATVLKDF